MKDAARLSISGHGIAGNGEEGLVSDSVVVRVFLNESEDLFFGYREGNALREASEFEVSRGDVVAVDGAGWPKVLGIVFEQLNIDIPETEWARRCLADRHRSLSVGDVVVIGESAFAVERFGWRAVSLVASQVRS